MISVEIIAVGRLKKGSLFDLFAHYRKQLKGSFKLHEIESKYKSSAEAAPDEHKKIAALIRSDAFVVAMDERGKSLRSMVFAKKIQDLQNVGTRNIQFIIGGSDGLSDDIRGRADLLLSFGGQTWPHMLARIMLIEQIYRAQQILAGHPYHRE